MTRSRGLTGCAVAVALFTMLMASACGPETAQNASSARETRGKSAPPGSAQNTPASVTALFDRLSAAQPLSQGGPAAAAPASQAAAPIAESPKIERKRTSETSSAKSLERVGYDGVEPAQLFPPVAAQVPQVWIGWYVNRSIDAFRQAIDENKPLVLVVGEESCEYCTDLANDSLRCAVVDRFAGDAVFAFSYLSSDRGATSIAGSLKIDSYPSITVLEPETRMLVERGRIKGYFESDILGGHLETILWKTQPRVRPDDLDGALAGRTAPGAPRTTWTPHLARPDSVTTALFGEAKRGLTHTPPAPKCR